MPDASAPQPLSAMPGPRPKPLIGNVGLLRQEPRAWRLFARLRANHGGLCVFWKGPTPIVAVQDPDLQREILVHRLDEFYKKAPIPALAPVVTNSPFGTNRRTAPTDHKVGDWETADARSPLHHVDRGWGARHRPGIADVVDRTLGNLIPDSGKAPIDLLDACRRLHFDCLSLQVVGRVLDGPQEDRYDDFFTISAEGDRRSRSLFGLPELPPAFVQAFARWAETFGEAVAAARSTADPQRIDLLAVTLQHGTPLTDHDLALELGNAWFGGLLSPASTLVSALLFIDRTPGVRERLEAELEADPAGDDGWVFLRACVREAQRLVPPVPLYFRNSSVFEDVELGGYLLPPDTTCLINTFGVQRDPGRWRFPEHYRPERWVDWGDDAARNVRDGWFTPYGMGPRACTGARLAEVSILNELASLLRRVRVRITNPDEQEEVLFGSVMALSGLRARFEERP